MKTMELFSLNQYLAADAPQQSRFQILFILKAFFAGLTGDNSLKTVDELTYGLLELPAYDLAAQHLKQDPAAAELIRDRYIPADYDLEELLTYPKDSLGYSYAAAIQAAGFDPHLHRDMEAETDAQYVELRLSQTHDIWHVITGFDTSVAGEIGLQAFHLAQFPYPLAAMLLANTLMSATLLMPEELPALVESIIQGFQLGKRAQSLFAQRWEAGWKKSLHQWRSELNVQPVLVPSMAELTDRAA